MDLKPRAHDKIVALIDKGVEIPNPLTIDIGDEVDAGRISADGVALLPGCRLYGSKTTISAGCRLGAEGPVVVDDCRLGPDVQLKAGYFKMSVFLEKASMGLGAQVREGCLLEEEANGAHCVGLKQTILFPFVTLGSLINFCDCLMAGGTSRKDHSEVGSSYVHFNYTPDGDKTTPSLFGDVPRGVMLDQAPIFLGGQGGAVGPVRVGFGSVIAAGSVLRQDVLDDGRLVIAAMPPGTERERVPFSYGSLVRIVRNNVVYLANLTALEAWYRSVRAPFFGLQEFGPLMLEGALEMLSLARDERLKRLVAMAGKVSTASGEGRSFVEHIGEVRSLFERESPLDAAGGLVGVFRDAAEAGSNYLETVRGLSADARESGVEWLSAIVAGRCARADELLADMDLFDRRT